MMIYIGVGVCMWPLFWLGIRSDYSLLPWGQRLVIVTWLAIIWPIGVVIMAALDHAGRHP